MWWQDESGVSREVERLAQAWRDEGLPGVVAIGSTWDSGGRRVPFVGLDHRLDPRPEMWAPGRGPGAALTRALIHRLGPLPSPRSLLERPSFVPPAGVRNIAVLRALWILLRLRRLEPEGVDRLIALRLADNENMSEVWSALLGLEISPDTQLAYLGPFRLVGGRGTRIFGRTGGKATVGCVLEGPTGTYFSTAGHLGAQAGERIFFRLRSAFGLRKQRPAGHVAASTWPGAHNGHLPTAVGVDFAIVRPDEERPSHLPVVIVGDAAAIEDKQHLSWNGASTGQREGWVSSVLTETRGKDVRHRNTLRVMGPVLRGAAADGDSGTAVFTLDGQLVGHIVGTEGYRHRAAGQAALVQDARTSLDYAESHVGPIAQVRGDRGGEV